VRPHGRAPNNEIPITMLEPEDIWGERDSEIFIAIKWQKDR